MRFATDGSHAVRYVCEPFEREPDFGAVSVNYGLDALWERGRCRGDTRPSLCAHFALRSGLMIAYDTNPRPAEHPQVP